MSMRAAVCNRYGPPDVVVIQEVEKPVPKANEILIKIRATTVSSGDVRVRSLNMPPGFGIVARPILGWLRPRQPILGSELAGDVVAVGKDVTKFKIGDAVFAFPGVGLGCHAAYRTMAEDRAVALKPAHLSYEDAAALSFGGMTALDFLKKGNIRRGEKILIIGASGAVGAAAVQLAKYFGADVTGVCSTANVNLVMSLGADKVIDYTSDDFMQSGERYDMILNAAGTASYAGCIGALKERGRLLLVLAGLPDILRSVWGGIRGQKRVFAGPAADRPQDLLLIRNLVNAGVFHAVIDRRYPFEKIVEAYTYVDTGRKKGSVVLSFAP